jgi:hypothetical protein
VKGTANQSTNSNSGGIYYTNQRIKFTDNMYVWPFCVMADGKTVSSISDAMSAIASTAVSVVTGGASTVVNTVAKDAGSSVIQKGLDVLVELFGVHPGYVYCYNVKFKDATSKDKIYPEVEFASDPSTEQYATNSYLVRYTANGISKLSIIENDPDHRLDLEYPSCPAGTSCPCRGQYCGIFSFSMLTGQTDANDTVVMAAMCIEYPAKNPTHSYIFSFGDASKIKDTAKPPPEPDADFAPGNFNLLVPESGGCIKRGFMPKK